MKILNLYAGIGGNRKLWGNEHDVTAIEINPDIAKIYQDFFPEDKVIVTDAHQYLLEHYKEFDFIWSSPPCPTHSRINNLNYIKEEQGQTPKFPDLKLYEEIIFLKHWFKGKWVVENVISYYEPLIIPYERDSHYFWANFYVGNAGKRKRYIREHLCDFNLTKHIDEDFMNIQIKNKEQILNNCVKPNTGLYVFNCAFKIKQEVLI